MEAIINDLLKIISELADIIASYQCMINDFQSSETIKVKETSKEVKDSDEEPNRLSQLPRDKA